ncbi:GumC family protein [Anaerocolumna chitinilytica]|uniref:Polysaccharide chain length determinant N-terminal domain-containing protein n=1 Tax=Anaerocolumna chitinilytica TaxID=1727145 RepID=A0A7I8DUA1_9FIRM|nr:Wzz/FepE/Etk N-terminal domain-containing protein [Anaerocolumna chitinilytica]BCK00822.1 hypothetical protein bsdcttw_38620 [Anaerocolumna chitinilytica]
MYKEFSLRHFIEIFLKGKWIISVITIISIVICGMYSFIFVKPAYNATTVLSTNPIQKVQNNNSSDEISEMIGSLGQYPDMTVETYKEQFLNPTVLGETINELNLTDKNGKHISLSNLASKVTVSIVNGTNLIKVIVNYNNYETAANIANKLSEKFITYISNNSKKLGEQASNVIEAQMEDEEKKLEEQAEIVQKYLASAPDVDQMKLEIEALNKQITDYKGQLNNVEKQIVADNNTLQTIKKQTNLDVKIDLSDTINFNIPLDKDITEDSKNSSEDSKDTSDVSNNSDQDEEKSNTELQLGIEDANKLQEAIITVKITEIETRLLQNISQRAALKEKTTGMAKDLEELQSTLAKEQYKYNAIKRNYDLAEQTYNAYLERHKESIITAASNIGESAIIISSPAVSSDIPVGKSKLFYIALGGVFGIILGVLIVLFDDYWKMSKLKI